LSCAYKLSRLGYQVTVFDREKEMGGMMRYGIPEYRLPRDVLDREISAIAELGVKMQKNRKIESLSELNEYDAVFLATGASEGIPLNVAGADSQGIYPAVDFLYRVNTGKTTSLDKEVVVVGGGSVALDAARTAIRLGAPKVSLVCLESSDYKDKEPMPAQQEEVIQAVEEGVIIHDKCGVHSFVSQDGAVKGVTLIECLGVKGDSGQFSPRYACEPGQTLTAGLVLLALGQRPSSASYPNGTPIDQEGKLDHVGHFQSKNPRIFAGGDILTGMVDIVSAVAAGNEAAISIHRFLEGDALHEERFSIPLSARPRLEKKSQSPAACPANQRCHDFKEVSPGFNPAQCTEQSERCLSCGSLVPSSLIRREMPKKNIIPWDKREAIELWSKRCPEGGEILPNVIDDLEEVLNPSEPPAIFREKLMLKASTSEDKLLYTMDDE
jgi:NADPH-dependent glutamate synthase beta subunit-like oxidoreductase